MEHELTRTDTIDSAAVLFPVRLCKYVNERCAGFWVGLQKRGVAVHKSVSTTGDWAHLTRLATRRVALTHLQNALGHTVRWAGLLSLQIALEGVTPRDVILKQKSPCLWGSRRGGSDGRGQIRAGIGLNRQRAPI